MLAISKAADSGAISGANALEFPARKNRSQETYNRVGEIIGITN